MKLDLLPVCRAPSSQWTITLLLRIPTVVLERHKPWLYHSCLHLLFERLIPQNLSLIFYKIRLFQVIPHSITLKQARDSLQQQRLWSDVIYLQSLLLPCCDHNTRQNKLKGGEIYFGSQFSKVSVCHSGKSRSEQLSSWQPSGRVWLYYGRQGRHGVSRVGE